MSKRKERDPTCARSTDWVCTVYDPDEAIALLENAQYCTLGYERGEEKETLHLQGFCQFQTRVRLSLLKRIAATTHFEPRMGPLKKARDYCFKDDPTPYEQGVFRPFEQGFRSDIAAFIEDAKTKSVTDMYSLHPECMAKYRKAYDDVRVVFRPNREKKTLIYWYFGPNGTGKSTRAVLGVPPEQVYRKDASTYWWCGYDPVKHKRIVIDEITSNVPYPDLLHIGQPGQAALRVKGGTVPNDADVLVITSNQRPDLVYARQSADPDVWGALLRRCNFLRVRRHDTIPFRSVSKPVKWVNNDWVDQPGEYEYDVPPNVDVDPADAP